MGEASGAGPTECDSREPSVSYLTNGDCRGSFARTKSQVMREEDEERGLKWACVVA